jgi:hypothetical protein
MVTLSLILLLVFVPASRRIFGSMGRTLLLTLGLLALVERSNPTAKRGL